MFNIQNYTSNNNKKTMSGNRKTVNKKTVQLNINKSISLIPLDNLTPLDNLGTIIETDVEINVEKDMCNTITPKRNKVTNKHLNIFNQYNMNQRRLKHMKEEQLIREVENLINQNNPELQKRGYKKLKRINKEGTNNNILKVLYALCLELSIGTRKKKDKRSIVIYKEIIKGWVSSGLGCGHSCRGSIMGAGSVGSGMAEGSACRMAEGSECNIGVSLSLIRMIIIRTIKEDYRINKPESDLYSSYIEKNKININWIKYLSKNNYKIQYMLAIMYLNGIGVKRSFNISFKYFYLSSKLYYSKSIQGLAYCIFQKYIFPNNEIYGIDLFFISAFLGNKSSFYYLGYHFEKEIYFKKSIIIAKQFYKLGSKYNNLLSLTQLGNYYKDIYNNYKLALPFYFKAAKFGYPPAQYILSNYFKKNNYNFLYYFWLKQSAKQGLIIAQQDLALFLLKNNKNINEVFNWLLKSIFNLNPNALFYFANFLRNNSFNLINKNKVIILLYEIASMYNHIDSIIALAICYRNGILLKKDSIKSYKLILKATKLGDIRAQYCLGIYYYEGFGNKKDLKKSIYWYAKAAKNNSAISQCTLAYLIFKNNILNKLRPQAIKYLEISAKKGYMRSYDNIGYCYEKGYVYKKDLTKAFKYYFIASNSGVPYSHYNLARCYQYGLGINKDFTKALIYYYKGLFIGDTRCLNKIKEVLTNDIILEYTNLTKSA